MNVQEWSQAAPKILRIVAWVVLVASVVATIASAGRGVLSILIFLQGLVFWALALTVAEIHRIAAKLEGIAEGSGRPPDGP